MIHVVGDSFEAMHACLPASLPVFGSPAGAVQSVHTKLFPTHSKHQCQMHWLATYVDSSLLLLFRMGCISQ